jgi:hypothetical protein
VASLQREALEELSIKSLKFMADDPKYHTKLPEFNETMQALDERYAKVVSRLETERRVKAAHLKKQLMMNEEYTKKQHEVRNPSIVIIGTWLTVFRTELRTCETSTKPNSSCIFCMFFDRVRPACQQMQSHSMKA